MVLCPFGSPSWIIVALLQVLPSLPLACRVTSPWPQGRRGRCRSLGPLQTLSLWLSSRGCGPFESLQSVLRISSGGEEGEGKGEVSSSCPSLPVSLSPLARFPLQNCVFEEKCHAPVVRFEVRPTSLASLVISVGTAPVWHHKGTLHWCQGHRHMHVTLTRSPGTLLRSPDLDLVWASCAVRKGLDP